jgi:hypothetical protein
MFWDNIPLLSQLLQFLNMLHYKLQDLLKNIYTFQISILRLTIQVKRNLFKKIV